MNHPDKYKARRFDSPGRCRGFTDAVYQRVGEHASPVWKEIQEARWQFAPEPPTYGCFTGDMHGHTTYSDGSVDVDTYFQNLRDVAKLDFAALTDHDHGGVAHPTLWAGGKDSKWEQIKKKVKEYRQEGSFTTLLAYERDSYPFFNNLVLYFRNDDASMILDEHPGEFTEEGFRRVLSDPNILAVPHDTYDLSSGGDFIRLDPELIPPFMEIISRGDAAEYMGNPAFRGSSACEGGFFQDALRKGGRIGVIGGSDDHGGTGGQVVERFGYPWMYPGVTGVWAEENTHQAIFDALVAKRTFAYMLGKSDGRMQGRMEIDFRINGHWMGESIHRQADEDLRIYLNVKSDVELSRVTLVKNCRDYISLSSPRELIFDYHQENPTDSYYLRVELKDGRFGWTSPIWVEAEERK